MSDTPREIALNLLGETNRLAKAMKASEQPHDQLTLLIASAYLKASADVIETVVGRVETETDDTEEE